MRYWLDTEFLEDGLSIHLISIGIVAEDGREFYYENDGFDWDRATDWLNENVRPHLTGPGMPKWKIGQGVRNFTDPAMYGKPEFWGYYADYDWVVFCWLFGTMMDLPTGFPMYCRDIKQWADHLGNPTLPPQEGAEHNALADARWNRRAWEFLRDRAGLSVLRSR